MTIQFRAADPEDQAHQFLTYLEAVGPQARVSDLLRCYGVREICFSFPEPQRSRVHPSGV